MKKSGLLVEKPNFCSTSRIDSSVAHRPSSGIDGWEHLLAEDLACAFDPAVDEVIMPEIDQDEGCLLNGQVHIDLASFEVLFAAWRTDGCAVLVVSDG